MGSRKQKTDLPQRPTNPARWPALMTRDDVAEYLRCSPTTVSRITAAGDLETYMLRGSPRYRIADVDAFIDGLGKGKGKCAAYDARLARESAARAEKRRKSAEKRARSASTPQEMPA